MAWFKADDMLADHPKVIALGKDAVPAMGLWLLVGTWAARYTTDGFVPDAMIRRYDPRRRLSKRLVEVGLWDRAEHDGTAGYQFHDWLDHQLSAEEVSTKRSSNRERQRKFRAKNGRYGTDPGGPGGKAKPDEEAPDQQQQAKPPQSNGVSHAVSNALPNALVTSTPSRPDPTRTSSSGDIGGGALVGNARTINDSPPTRPRCERHRNLADDDPGPPCHGCRHAREVAEGATAQAAAAGQAQRAERRARVDECDQCDEYGFELDEDHTPAVPARRCQHRQLRSVS